MENMCYCKKCDQLKKVLYYKINKKDIMKFKLSCGHERYFLLITHSLDYKKEEKNEKN